MKEEDELTNVNYAKVIVIFIRNKRKNKNLYFVNIQSEKDIELHILILSQLNYKTYKYDISYNDKVNLIDHLNLFNYIYNLNDEYALESLSKQLVENQIDSPLINRINLDNISFEKVLEYSQKYPNRIKLIDFYIFKDYNKIKKIIELNQQSLVSYPHGKIEFLVPLPNAYIFTLIELSPYNLYDNYHLEKIIIVNGIKILEDEENLYIKFLNKVKKVWEGTMILSNFFKIFYYKIKFIIMGLIEITTKLCVKILSKFILGK